MHSAVTCKYVNTRRIPWQNHWVKQGLNSQPQTNQQPSATNHLYSSGRCFTTLQLKALYCGWDVVQFSHQISHMSI